MSICEQCQGAQQRQHEPLRYLAVVRRWLCAVCREAIAK
ncbi:hypothetical protein SEA_PHRAPPUCCINO_128 [Mycobacterium phage Phrappuccino]|uniref:Uncharacterized protein n=1 Tax=Mycobacterium phage Phrappuccino TaxID=2591223 RepID=A0A514DDW0_9CAUD|nr:hypothetical protein KHQ87_gp128 [Mycobacterium phage Phrappuccino]QDH91803.1 hypothetical protein SEA_PHRAPPUCCINO_128 [Mycobacterium phage Phrappuccino]QIQ63245.1 hypothetical protein SEA_SETTECANDELA_128 [Mycobacterium phage Settecandela]